MINQRLYSDILLGNGKVTIGTDGCYLAVICWGLQLRGYTYTLPQLNTLFKQKGVFSPGSAMLGASTIQAKVPEIFIEGRNEGWSDTKLINYLKNPDYMVIGEVSGRGIGGSGQHFVYIDKVDVKDNGTIAMTWIDDPWDGLDNRRVTDRYNKLPDGTPLGNILSLRVFKVNRMGGTMPAVMYGSPNQYDLNNNESMKVAVDELNKVQTGQYISRAKYEADKEAEYNHGFTDGKNSVPVVTPIPTPINPKPPTWNGKEPNGVVIETDKQLNITGYKFNIDPK